MDPFTTAIFVGRFAGVLLDNLRKAEEQKVDYAAKLEAATGDDIFKYLLLIDVAALDSYTSQTRLQAQRSFGLSRLVAIVGFLMISVAVALGVASQLLLKEGPRLRI